MTTTPDTLVAWLDPTTCPSRTIDCDQPSIRVRGNNTIWLVTSGALDMFAVDTLHNTRWHHLGRLYAGAILLTPPRGSQHTLILRPLENAGLATMRASDLFGYHAVDSREREAVAAGIDQTLTLLLGSLHTKLPPRDFTPLEPGADLTLAAGQHGRSAEGLVWLDLIAGELEFHGHKSHRERHPGQPIVLAGHDWVTCSSYAHFKVHTTGQMWDQSSALWRSLLITTNQIMYMIDRAVEAREAGHRQKILAGRETSRAAARRSEQLLQAVLDPAPHIRRSEASVNDDPTAAACHIVADELGMSLANAVCEPGDSRIGPIEQIAIRSRVRSRTVALKGTWWRTNIGPLVGHRTDGHTPIPLVWRRGRYRTLDPGSGTKTPVTRHNAETIAPWAVTFYRPLPERTVSGWQFLRHGLHGSTRDIFTLTVGVVVAATLGVLVPLATGTVLGTLIPRAQTTLIVQLSLALITATAAAAVFASVENLALLRIEGRFESILQAAIWDRLLRLPASFFRRFTTGELASAALGIENIRTVLMDVSAVVLYASATVAVNYFALFWFSPQLAFLATVLLLINIAASVILGMRQMKWQRKSLKIGYKLTDGVFQTLRGLPKLRVAQATDRAFSAWAIRFSMQKEIQKRIGRYQNASAVFSSAYPTLCTLVLFSIIASTTGNSLPPGRFLAFNAAFAVTTAALTQITATITTAINVLPMFQRLNPLLTEPLEITAGATIPGELSGDLEVNHISFSYDAASPLILDGFSFKAKAGQMVAIVGPSGCGKSTLLRILLGFEQPDRGTILYDGQDLASLDISAVRRQCGVVLQQAKPFTGSIFQAITGAQNYSLEDAWEAADMAGIRADIEAMPMGMHTLITDGSTLSGGQSQRLLIAQALIRKPRLLFLDEATSALDNETQRIVTQSTQRLQATRIVIAHRLSTIMNADHVIVMTAGRVAQAGTPTELLADTAGTFHHLVHRQIP
ncbi:NHLP bacteriocin export ABC transporter permease/ATPase subunit [Streptomyces sp. NPDC006173]|uniref:NHLP bacteriocin export ABC transporter permease/ATPase subunit n=1 Tax=Streptomyces sp. NPDC006173 TaxID=3155349 RepID=UPI0034082F5D